MQAALWHFKLLQWADTVATILRLWSLISDNLLLMICKKIKTCTILTYINTDINAYTAAEPSPIQQIRNPRRKAKWKNFFSELKALSVHSRVEATSRKVSRNLKNWKTCLRSWELREKCISIERARAKKLKKAPKEKEGNIWRDEKKNRQVCLSNNARECLSRFSC